MTLEEATKATLEFLNNNIDNSNISALTMAASDKLGTYLDKIFNDCIGEVSPLATTIIFPAMYTIALEAYKMHTEAYCPDGFTEDSEKAVESIVEYSRQNGFLMKLRAVLERRENEEA